VLCCVSLWHDFFFLFALFLMCDGRDEMTAGFVIVWLGCTCYSWYSCHLCGSFSTIIIIIIITIQKLINPVGACTCTQAFEFGHTEQDDRNPLMATLFSGALFLVGSLPSVIPFICTSDKNLATYDVFSVIVYCTCVCVCMCV
jgi:hypothetical protein